MFRFFLGSFFKLIGVGEYIWGLSLVTGIRGLGCLLYVYEGFLVLEREVDCEELVIVFRVYSVKFFEFIGIFILIFVIRIFSFVGYILRFRGIL